MKVNEDGYVVQLRRQLGHAHRRQASLTRTLERVVDALDPAMETPTVRQRDELVEGARAVLREGTGP